MNMYTWLANLHRIVDEEPMFEYLRYGGCGCFALAMHRYLKRRGIKSKIWRVTKRYYRREPVKQYVREAIANKWTETDDPHGYNFLADAHFILEVDGILFDSEFVIDRISPRYVRLWDDKYVLKCTHTEDEMEYMVFYGDSWNPDYAKSIDEYVGVDAYNATETRLKEILRSQKSFHVKRRKPKEKDYY